MLFGTNSTQWLEIEHTVGGLHAIRAYDSADAHGDTGGVPQAWPGASTGGIPPSARPVIQIVSFKPDIAAVLDGRLDKELTAFFKGAPAGSMCTAWHEGNFEPKMTKGGYTADQFTAVATYLHGLAASVNRGLVYGQIFLCSPVAHGQDLHPFIAPGMGFYGLDGYQGRDLSNNPAAELGPSFSAITAIEPAARIGITETGAQAPQNPGWLTAAYQWARERDLFLFSPFFWDKAPPDLFFSARDRALVDAMKAISAECGPI